MSTLELKKLTIARGVWMGALVGVGAKDQPPHLFVEQDDVQLDIVEVNCTDSGWQVQFPIPIQMIHEGANVAFVKTSEGEVLASLTLIADDMSESDLRSEVALLRGELDMLKKAFCQVNHG